MSTHTTIVAAAINYAAHHWRVGPLCHRDPSNPRRILHPYGKDPVGHLVPHGVLDFTTDINTVIRWWSRYPWNINAAVPEGMFVLDVDGPDRRPHPGRGLVALAELEDRYESVPATWTQITGSGGLHLGYRRPPGKISHKRLPEGLEIKKPGGYLVMAPSIHPDSHERYVRCDYPVAAPPPWLTALLRPEPPKLAPRRPHPRFCGPSVADKYSVNTSWADVLEPFDWRCLDANPDGDGARWLHPTATSSYSATIRHSCLFVYSPNTPFEVTESSNPNGYTRFRAYALLNHNGDMSAAASALAKGVA